MNFYSLPRDYDSQFQAPEPEGMHGVMGSDPNRYEDVPSREPSVCKNCGEPIEYFPSIPVPCFRWKHVAGLYGCNKGRPMHSPTSAEPAEPSVISPTAENLAWRKRLDDACKEKR